MLQAFGSGCWRWILLAAAALVTVVMLMIVGCFVTFRGAVRLAFWGTGPTMLVAAVLTAVGFLVCVFTAEETKGMTLAQAGGEPESATSNDEQSLQTD
ncbi:hypothetical protein G9E11_06835 [Arthrobacter sp. IA7]|uniref:hypothetical protein n=1 Tax=Arthrobacter ipis TaxID=2716202 RepID=UPI001687F644|nr:hypothetical protein [Arthrobacter ipis]MBD1541969.1 hypothetical protein [Arthrobacter ipis]